MPIRCWQGSKGNPSPMKSSDIEKKFQRNPSDSISFMIANDSFEIRFTGVVYLDM